jgi:aldose 1-epimerase
MSSQTRSQFLRSLTMASGGLLFTRCQHMTTGSSGTVAAVPFGKTKSGEAVTLFKLINPLGAEVHIMDLGGTVVSVKVPDREGKLGDVVLGFDNVGDYESKSPFFGCITGRYANRIAKGQFSLDGKSYNLAVNNAPNHLHGGKVGFDKKVWKGVPGVGAQVIFSHTSPNGDEGYPGALNMKVTYTWTDENALRIDYQATTDAKTIVNLTNHSYFNLGGAGNGTILDHEMTLFCDQFTPTDDTMIPTGKLAPVAGTPLDFSQPTLIGQRIGADYLPLKQGKGYDHNYVINGSGLRKAAKARDPKTGRVLEVFTDQPGVQLYTGNFLDGTVRGKGGNLYPHRGGFCLETQKYPDSPNQASFPSCELAPGQTYEHVCIYKFSVG